MAAVVAKKEPLNDEDQQQDDGGEVTSTAAQSAATTTNTVVVNAENITDIQNYLASFNKEIQGGGNGSVTVTQLPAGTTITEAGTAAGGAPTAYIVTPDGQYHPYTEGGTYFTTSDGNTFFAANQAPGTEGSGQGAGGGQTQQIVLAVQQQGGATNADGTTGQVQLATATTADGTGGAGQAQVVLNAAAAAAGGSSDGSSYQTVTIVPSDTNPGEVSYVLIVSQPPPGAAGAGGANDQVDIKDKASMDMSVYDFGDDPQKAAAMAVGSEQTTGDGLQTMTDGATGGGNESSVAIPEGTVVVTASDGSQVVTAPGITSTKVRTLRVVPKKSQSIAQVHMCNYCNYTSPKRFLLSRHMRSHSEERPHKCSICERGFKTIPSLQNHVNTHTGTRPHQCRECEAAFTTCGELVRHVRYKHTHEKPHRCTECDYASVELSKLKRHMRCHTGERPYQCPHCTYASPDTYKLKRHLRIHTGEKPYQCDICAARFTQSNSLKAHKLIHTGEKPVFHCELCPTTCGRKTDLRIHVQKLHTSDKPLKCKRCGKNFPDRYTYRVHVKSHEGEKCFKCDLCTYASASQRHLESHMLIHSEQKPFQCDMCDQSFRQKQLLKRHKNLYHDPNYVPPTPKEKTHICPECNKPFLHKGNLIRHLVIHDPEASAQDRADALRIGVPKGPGEERDGEEEEEEEEEGEEWMDTTTDGGGHPTASMGDGSCGMAADDGTAPQQVVVFEVIQLPPGAQGSGQATITSQMFQTTAGGGASTAQVLATAPDGSTLILQPTAITTTTANSAAGTSYALAAASAVAAADGGSNALGPLAIADAVPVEQPAEPMDESGSAEGEMGSDSRTTEPVPEVEQATTSGSMVSAKQETPDADDCFGFNDDDADAILSLPAAAPGKGNGAGGEEEGTTYILVPTTSG